MQRILPLFFSLLALLALGSCANQGQGPDGGPYDEHPPRIVHLTPPEKMMGSKRTKFTLTFDELIKVENPQEKIIVSPPQIETPEIKVSGRRITVELMDSLRPGTTYTVDFSDAIVDNNEGNPLGQYTYVFNTSGAVKDTMEISGHVINADDLEPVKGALVGLHQNDADTAFTRLPFERVARTDDSGFFSIKGVAPGREYNIFALKDADGDFRFSQRGEHIAFLLKKLRPSSFPDVRQDTLWVDSVRYDSIRVTPFTHFTPDDVVLTLFREKGQTRNLLKAERPQAELWRSFFTGPSQHVPTIKGLNFKSEGAFVEQRNLTNDSIVYWLADTTLLRQDTLSLTYTYEAWDDSLARSYLRTDTLNLTSRVSWERRTKAKAKEMEKWEKQRERRHKRGDYSQEQPPVEFLPIKWETAATIAPDRNLYFSFGEPFDTLPRSALHLRLKVDTLWHDAPFEIDTVPGQLLMRRLRAEWRPGQQYELTIDSAAIRSIFGKPNDKLKQSVNIAKNEELGTLFLTLNHANDTCTIVQLLDANGKVLKQARAKNGRVEMYYLSPQEYYLRCFFDHDGDDKWSPGAWRTRRPPEEMYYFPKALNVRANWDLNEDWDLTALPLNKQKPQRLLKQQSRGPRKSNTHQRNLDRKRQRGEM